MTTLPDERPGADDDGPVDHRSADAPSTGAQPGSAQPGSAQPAAQPAARSRPSPPPSDLDYATALQLRNNTTNSLTTARAQAQNWLTLCTVVSGLVAVVTVLNGPAAASELDTGWRWGFAGTVVIGFGALVWGIVTMYRAAYGNPDELLTINPSPVLGAHARVVEASMTAAGEVRAGVSRGSIRVLAGTAIVVGTAVGSWLV